MPSQNLIESQIDLTTIASTIGRKKSNTRSSPVFDASILSVYTSHINMYYKLLMTENSMTRSDKKLSILRRKVYIYKEMNRAISKTATRFNEEPWLRCLGRSGRGPLRRYWSQQEALYRTPSMNPLHGRGGPLTLRIYELTGQLLNCCMFP
jgi:hypothetical protein